MPGNFGSVERGMILEILRRPGPWLNEKGRAPNVNWVCANLSRIPVPYMGERQRIVFKSRYDLEYAVANGRPRSIKDIAKRVTASEGLVRGLLRDALVTIIRVETSKDYEVYFNSSEVEMKEGELLKLTLLSLGRISQAVKKHAPAVMLVTEMRILFPRLIELAWKRERGRA